MGKRKTFYRPKKKRFCGNQHTKHKNIIPNLPNLECFSSSARKLNKNKFLQYSMNMIKEEQDANTLPQTMSLLNEGDAIDIKNDELPIAAVFPIGESEDKHFSVFIKEEPDKDSDTYYNENQMIDKQEDPISVTIPITKDENERGSWDVGTKKEELKQEIKIEEHAVLLQDESSFSWRQPSTTGVATTTLLPQEYSQSHRGDHKCIMNDSKVLFSVTEDEKLVERIAKHPSLYDLQSEAYKDQIIKDNAWKEIAKYLGRSAEDCKKRWRNVRDTYKRRKRTGKGTEKWALSKTLSFLEKVEHKRLSTSNIGNDSVHSNDIDMSSNDHDDDDSQDLSEKSIPSSVTAQNDESNTADLTKTLNSTTSAGNIRPPGKREKLNERIVNMMERNSDRSRESFKRLRSQGQEDSVDLFFRSLAMSVKKLRPELINEAKRRTLELVIELESRIATPIHSPSIESACRSRRN